MKTLLGNFCVLSISCVRRNDVVARVALGIVIVLATITAPLGAVPASPTNLSANVAGNAVSLTWTAPAGVVRAYRVEAGTASGRSNLASAIVGATPSVFVPGVPAGTYYVRVRAVASDGESAPSNEVVVRVGQQGCITPPSPPRDVTAAVTASTVTLSWTPSSGCGATHYIVVGSSPGGSDLAIAHVGGVSTISVNAPNGVYYVRVVATNAYGIAPSNSVTVVVGSRAAPAAPPSTPSEPSPPPPSAPSAPTPTTGKGGTLRVMTWNIHHGRTKSGAYDPLAQAKFIASQNPHVVALQEVQTWNDNQPARYEQLLEQLTGHQWTRQWAPVVDSANTEGNVVLTRLPIVSSSSHQMHATGDWDAMYSNRSAARLTISVGGVNVHVFSTHLDYYNTAHRTAQLLDLMNWTEQYGARRIVAGDFNSTPGEYWITTMLGDYTDTWRDVTGSSSGGGTINGVRFDYLFRAKHGAEDVRPVRINVLTTNLSDHAPVIAEYTVTP